MNTFITYAFVILVIFAVWSFVYEVILLPSIRLSLRFKMFALRDRLRTLKLEHDHQLDDETFQKLDMALSVQMDSQHKLTFPELIDADREYNRNAELKEYTDQSIKVIERCQLPEYRDIRAQAVKYFAETVFANSGAWAVFVLPILLCVVGMAWIQEHVKRLVFAQDKTQIRNSREVSAQGVAAW